MNQQCPKPGCNLTQYSSEGLCILHSQNPKKDAATFEQAARQRLNLPLTTISFTDVLFPKEFSFRRQHFKNADFSGAIFAGAADFSETTFDGFLTLTSADFRDEASFRHAEIKSSLFAGGAKFIATANFCLVKIGGVARFDTAKFFGPVGFSRAHFAEDASFALTTFNDIAEFDDGQFMRSVSFNRTRFLKGANFKTAAFRSRADFTLTEFSGDGHLFSYHSPLKIAHESSVTFFQSRFEGETYFVDNDFGHGADFSYAVFTDVVLFVHQVALTPIATQNDKGPGIALTTPKTSPFDLDFRNVLFGRPELVRFEHYNLERTKLAGANTRGIALNNPRWPFSGRIGKRPIVYDEIDADPTDPSLRKVGRLYRDLKANLEDSRDFPKAGDFYYREMEIQRKIRRQGEPEISWKMRRYGSPYAIYWLAAGYGERPFRAALTFLAVWLFLGVLFTQRQFVYDRHIRVTPQDALSDLDPADTSTVHRTEATGTLTSVTVGPAKPHVSQALGHSLRTLTLQRSTYFRPYSDDAWAHGLTLVGNVLGPLQLALLAIALRRRFRR